MRRTSILLALAWLLASPGPAAWAGGSIRAFALLPNSGRVAAVDVEQHRIARLIDVPRGRGPLAASLDGRRVLVGNTARGIVREVDGLSGRTVWTLRNLGRPVALQMLPNAALSTGYVHPRYAVAADADGQIIVLDLERGRIAARRSVPRPLAVALDGDRLWVASSDTTRLTIVNLADPRTPSRGRSRRRRDTRS
jgi:hypothetical protein